MTFSVELVDPDDISEGAHSVVIHIDRISLKELILDLQQLETDDVGEHFHYFSNSWGGHALSETPLQENSAITHHLKITLVATNPLC